MSEPVAKRPLYRVEQLQHCLDPEVVIGRDS